MADKNLQFLDIPRTDPEKVPVETRVQLEPTVDGARHADRQRAALG